jgi:CheY-like chemotaxis protein/sRNA-binding carbon storage regulator CsrA
LRVQGNTARLGIEAPPEVPIRRHEIADLKSIEFAEDQNSDGKLRRLVHAVRHRLDAAATALNRLHRRSEQLVDETAQELVLQIFRELKTLEQEAAEAAEVSEPRRMRALLVDHHDNERELLAAYLRDHGFETTSANDGRDALDYLSLHAPPDVVLLDMQMPNCNGRCFVKSVRACAELEGLKLIAVSDEDPAASGVPLGPGGLDRWIPKPVDPEQLVSQLTGALVVPATAM